MHPEVLKKARQPKTSSSSRSATLITSTRKTGLPYIPFGAIMKSLDEISDPTPPKHRVSPTIRVNVPIAQSSQPDESAADITSASDIPYVTASSTPYPVTSSPFDGSVTMPSSMPVPAQPPHQAQYGMKPIAQPVGSVLSGFADVEPAPKPNVDLVYDVTQRNRYLDIAGVPVKEYGTNFTAKDDLRSRGWAIQREMYGFDEREMWNLDCQFMQWLYSRCMFFLDHNLCSDVFVEFDGEIYSQEKALREICADAIFCIRNQFTQDQDIEDDVVNRMCRAARLWAEVLPAMWTDLR